MFLIAIGYDIFAQDFKLSLYSYLLYVIFASFFVSCFYTMATRTFMQALGSLAYLSLAFEVFLLVLQRLFQLPSNGHELNLL